MARDEAPPGVDGVDVRRIETLEEHRAGLEIVLAAANWTASGAAGLFLAGGSTLPEARGRGCYRAPILRKLGFTELATVHTLQ